MCVRDGPAGSERRSLKWREADLEWLGSKPTQVQTSVFETGQEQPHAQDHDLTSVGTQMLYLQAPGY